MLKIIEKHAAWARVRGSWSVVQRAAWQENQRYSSKRHLRMDGSENLLTGGAKAYHKSCNGIWLISGYAADGSDVDKALAAMQISWAQAQDNKQQLLAA
ncbi:hypothetical protein [Ottowia sp.]|uniref:hypothetical protein n=1 Tax=Ottowia sp. TaxID=1898956 RepID=UPI0025F54E31|nr:hypothetical protein [Ottowia sp.]MBK6616563.1 hypothetical protein [Ottowia sp.]